MEMTTKDYLRDLCSDAERRRFANHAAILENEGEFHRAMAEKMAYQAIVKARQVPVMQEA